MLGEARSSISSRLMIEIACGDSMIGVALFVVEMAADRPVAVTTMTSESRSASGAVWACASREVPDRSMVVSVAIVRM